MSTINTSSIDVNYPIPGQNNSTQGFRDNFATIKNNLNIAATEITDLQNKAVLKAALANSTIDNNMANTLIANASTLQFRSTMYNLGNALVDNVVVDCSLGDVQYGNLIGNINLKFNSWVPTSTEGGVELQLGRPGVNENYTITLPAQALPGYDYGWTFVENSQQANGNITLTFPYGVTQLNLKLTTTDCGNSLYVRPLNRSFQTTQIQRRTPPSTGQSGDTVGTVCVDPGTTQLTITGANISTNSYFTTNDTSTLTPGLPVNITGQSLTANVVVGNTYYIKEILSNTTFTLTEEVNGAEVIVGSNVTGNTMYLNPVQYMYIAVQDFNAAYSANPENVATTTAPNLLVLTSFSDIAVNNPIIFTGNTVDLNNVGLSSGKVYYIKNAWSGNYTISLSEFRYNGIAGLEYQGIVSNTTPMVDSIAYNGSDIFRRVPLQPF